MLSATPRDDMKFYCTVCLLIALFFGVACARKEPTSAAVGSTYALRGEVVKVLPETKTVFVAHEAISGLMPAMTMEFTLSDAELAKLRPGQRIAAQLVLVRPGEFELRRIEPFDPVQTQLVQARAKELRQDTFIRGKSAYREIGEQAPSFALLNQDGKAVEFSHFRGKQVVLNFIYTRCPVATMCPAATAHMMELQRLARDKGVRNLELVSISFDPAYDTPIVLKEYAATRGIDTSNFTFLTGPESAVRDLFAQFGVVVEPGENILKHSLATVLFDANGRIVHRVDGSKWEARDFLQRLSSDSH